MTSIFRGYFFYADSFAFLRSIVIYSKQHLCTSTSAYAKVWIQMNLFEIILYELLLFSSSKSKKYLGYVFNA